VIAHVCARPAAAPAAALRVLSAAEVQGAPLRVDEHELLWVDVADPQDADVAWLERSFGFHPLALEDVARRHQRPKLDEYPGYYFGVLYAARVGGAPDAPRVTTSELQFFWGQRYFVTIHAEPFPEIDDLAARARAGVLAPVVHAKNRPLQIPDLVYRLIDAVVDGYFPAVDAFAEWIEDVEEQMFAGRRAPETLQTIFALRKDLFHLRRVVAPSREVVNVLLRRDHDLFGDEFYAFFQDVYDHTVRVLDSLDVYRDLLSSALDTHLSVVSNEVSQTVKKMTAVTAILMVNALVAGIYGMNFDVMPELSWRYGYAWALGLMAAATVTLWALFKRIRWL
jgi:magnesium transporter